MYCRNCGSKISESDKFCANCGTSVKKANSNNSYAQAARIIRDTELLAGLDDWLAEKLEKQPTAKPFLIGAELVKVYPTLNSPSNKYAKSIPADTRRFIIGKGFKEVFPVGLDTDELQALNSDEQESLPTKVIPIIDGIVTDTLIVGYISRILSSYVNENTSFEEFDGIDTPTEAAKYLLSLAGNGQMGDMFTDAGFSVPFGFSMLLNGGGLNDTIWQNSIERNPMARLLPESQIMFLLFMGWCLARFDLARKIRHKNK